MIRVMTDGAAIGPILMGVSKPAHILTSSATPRRIVNMTAIAAVDALIRKRDVLEAQQLKQAAARRYQNRFESKMRAKK